MFWKFDLHPQSAIDSILAKEDCTLSEILDEDDVLQECKSQNRKLIDFFVRPEILEELVNLVISEPADEMDEKIKYKHSNTACEVLTADVYTIIDKLTSNEDFVNKIWSFLDKEPPLNPLLASFFSKVMGVLISRKTSMMLEFLKSKEDFVNILMKHLGTSAIMDLLLRLVTSVESPQLRQDMVEWLNDMKLIEGLVSLIDPAIDEERNSNAAQTLSDIIRLSREHMSQLQESAEADPLLETIERRETVSELISHMLHEIHSHPDCALVNGVSVLLTLLERRRTSCMYQYSIEGEEPMTALDAERLAQGVSATLAAITPRLKDLHELLTDPPPTQAMLTTVGKLEPPFGNARLQVAKLIVAILATNSEAVNEELARLGTLKVLWDLFFKYSWNNFLHTQVEHCVSTILNNPPSEEDGERSCPLINVLFKDCNVVQRIVQAWDENDAAVKEKGGHRKGYMGHLTKIANLVVFALEKGKNKDMAQEVFDDLPEKDRERWQSFVTSALADMNKKNTSELVGHPLQSSSDDDDDFKPVPFLPNENSLQQAFSHYQMQQMTTEFMDTFGFDEDDFQEPEENVTAPFDRIGDIGFSINANEDNPNSALFEACCNERIQQFDDSGSDEEDIWEEKQLTFSSVLESRQSTISGEGESEESESSDSEEDAEGTPEREGSVASSGSGEEEDERIVFSDDTNSAKQSPVKSVPPKDNTDHKMEVDSSDAWNDPFESSEVAMEEAVTLNASDVGWGSSNSSGDTLSGESQDGGWAKFDAFTDLGMAQQEGELDNKPRPDSPVAMETEQSPLPQTGSSYVVGKSEDSTAYTQQNTCVDKAEGLVLSDVSVLTGPSNSPEKGTSCDDGSVAVSPPKPDRAALYSLENTSSLSVAPLASNESDDDIEDEKKDHENAARDGCEDSYQNDTDVQAFTNISPETPVINTADSQTEMRGSDRGVAVAKPSDMCQMTNSEQRNEVADDPALNCDSKDNGPVEFDAASESCQHSTNKKTRMDNKLLSTEEAPTPTLVNGPG